MGNKQALQQEPVKQSPHYESLSRLYEVFMYDPYMDVDCFISCLFILELH